MGIQGLLPFLDKASEKINVKSLRGSSIAIDSYCWLHKGAFAVGDKLARGEKTDVHIVYCLKYVNMLLSHNIKPILVFDGRHLPAKAETEAKRRETRKNAKQRAIELMKQGNHKEAQSYLRRCVDITHEMALELIKVCRSINVDCVVAPYEADAQLAYLNKIGLADYVITEDSDLTLFGCQKILFKLDLMGNCVLVDSNKFHLAMDCNLNKFTMDKFRLMCILSGCDYLDSLPGIGLAKACKFVLKTEETDIMRSLDKIPAYLNMRHLEVTEEYKTNVLKARATFLHMVVFDPRWRKQVHLHEIDELGTNIEYCSNAGEILDDKTALNLAVGNLNPFTMKALDNWHPDHRERSKNTTTISSKGLKIAKHSSIWNRDYRFAMKNGSNSNGTVAAPKVTVKKIAKPPKRNIEPIEDEDIPTESQNEEMILDQYINLNQPSLKRFKEDSESDDQSSADMDTDSIDQDPLSQEQTTPNRNPFKKTETCKNELLSPTRISKENNSLIKNQSPVKHIDFGKLQKLSRFSRTADGRKQPVLSRFFGAKSECETIDEPKTDSGPQMGSPDLFELTEKPKPNLYFEKSNDSGFSPNSEEQKNSQGEKNTEDDDNDDGMSLCSQRSILDKFKFAATGQMSRSSLSETEETAEFQSSQSSNNNKTDSEASELPTVLSDNENEIDNSQKEKVRTAMWLNGSKNIKATTKTAPKATLRRKKSTSLSSKSASNTNLNAQTRLSAFGFQAQPVMKR